MQLENTTIRRRLKETFGGESQEFTAGRLNVVQGTISKLLTGSQTLTLEMAYNIALEYGVSVDWLLGLSDEKYVSKTAETDYATAARVLIDLQRLGAIWPIRETDDDSFEIYDFLLLHLYTKGAKLLKLDQNYYKDWVKTQLNMFSDKEILNGKAWHTSDILGLEDESSEDAHWLEIYRQTKDSYDEYVKSRDGDEPLEK